MIVDNSFLNSNGCDDMIAAQGNSFPLVSVLVLSYRNIDGIYLTLDSILTQDYPNLEIVISDDASPGFSDCIDNIVRYIEVRNSGNVNNIVINSIKVNGGTVKNANAAVLASTGAYIKTISPEDCLASPHALSTYVSFMQNTDYKVCFAKLRGVDESGEYKYRLSSCESNYDKLRSYSVEQTRNRLFSRNFLPGAAEFFDRRIFDEYGLFPEKVRLIEDYSYWLHLSSCGVAFGYIDEVLVDYRLSGVSSSGHYGKAFMNDMFTIYNEFIFPHDQRFGRFQGVYNAIKKSGLNFYLAEAEWDEMTVREKVGVRLKYLPFCCFVRLQKMVFD